MITFPPQPTRPRCPHCIASRKYNLVFADAFLLHPKIILTKRKSNPPLPSLFNISIGPQKNCPCNLINKECQDNPDHEPYCAPSMDFKMSLVAEFSRKGVHS